MPFVAPPKPKHLVYNPNLHWEENAHLFEKPDSWYMVPGYMHWADAQIAEWDAELIESKKAKQ